MRPELSAAIFAARELAWQPTHNVSNPRRYEERRQAHVRLIEALNRVPSLSANAAPELAFLVEAMHRAARCSFANRKGLPYHERKQAIAELRGCLLAYDKARELKAA